MSAGWRVYVVGLVAFVAVGLVLLLGVLPVPGVGCTVLDLVLGGAR